MVFALLNADYTALHPVFLRPRAWEYEVMVVESDQGAFQLPTYVFHLQASQYPFDVDSRQYPFSTPKEKNRHSKALNGAQGIILSSGMNNCFVLLSAIDLWSFLKPRLDRRGQTNLCCPCTFVICTKNELEWPVWLSANILYN